MMKYKFLFLSILLGFQIQVRAQVNPVLQSKIDRILSSNEFKYSSESITFIDLESGEKIFGSNSELNLTPASTQKILTTFTAYKHLGPEFKFETEILMEGDLQKDGTLSGNIIIKGSGDPTLGSRKFKGTLEYKSLFKTIAQSIGEFGINCIEGDIIADEGIFDSYPVAPTWQWNDLGNYYASGAWGINVNENQYKTFFGNRGTIGRRPTIKYSVPEIPGLNLSNELSIDSSHTGDNAYIFGGPYNYNKRIVGTIPQGSDLFSIKGSIPDPPLFTAYLLHKSLKKNKIKSNDYRTNFRSGKKSKRQTIMSIRSPKLIDIIKRTNAESNNLYAEAILKTIGLKKRGQGSGQNGIVAIKRYMRQLKIDVKGINFADGSGLSVRNEMSSSNLASFLHHFARENTIDVAISLLPKGGYEGTVRSMFTHRSVKGNVWLKSGSMDRVLCYSGYLKTKHGKWLSFSILVNGFHTKSKVISSKIEQILQIAYLHH